MLDKLMAKLWLMSVSKKKDVKLFWSPSPLQFTHFTKDQVIAIFKIVDEKLVESFNFGLKISRNHVIKEKTAILTILNVMGSIQTITRLFNFEEARRFFLKSIYQILGDETKFYFEKWKEKNGVKNKYNCHIEAAAFSVLQSIYNADGKIPCA
jgi:hypothetical protein